MISALMCLLIFAVGAFAQTGSVTGRVVDSEGEGICRASILAKHAHRAISVIEESGQFTLQDLPAGPDTLTVGLIGYYTKNLPIVIIPGYTIDVEIVLDEAPITHEGASKMYPTPSDISRYNDVKPSSPKTGSVKGWVVDARGEAVIGAMIRESRAHQADATLEDGGNFLFEVLEPGPDTLHISAGGYETQEIPFVVRQDSTITLEVILHEMPSAASEQGSHQPLMDDHSVSADRNSRLAPMGTLRGNVVNPFASGAPHAAVRLINANLDTVVRVSSGNYFEFHCAAGKDILQISAIGQGTQTYPVEIFPDSTIKRGFGLRAPAWKPPVVPKTGSIKGRIVDSAGQGILGAVIYESRTNIGTDVRNESGKYLLWGLPVGTVTLKARAAGYEQKVIHAVVCEDSSITLDVILNDAPLPQDRNRGPLDTWPAIMDSIRKDSSNKK
jgi:hypothetical protein